MARASTTSDIYNAIAEPRRRSIFELLCQGELPVNDLVAGLHMEQPSVSKHLRVLREVGLVTVRQHGRQRLYSANPNAIRAVHEWVAQFERYWSDQLDSIKTRAETAQQRKTRKNKSRKDKQGR